MASEDKREELLRRLLDDKELTRQELARLPIEEKLKLMALMQRRANAIRRAVGRKPKPEWPLKEVGFKTEDPFREGAEGLRVIATFAELEAQLANAPGVAAVLELSDASMKILQRPEAYFAPLQPNFTVATSTASGDEPH